MSFISTACSSLATQANAPRPPAGHIHPAHFQAHGRLHRAIVSLPDSMCERDRPLQERWVFFDCPGNTNPGERLEARGLLDAELKPTDAGRTVFTPKQPNTSKEASTC